MFEVRITASTIEELENLTKALNTLTSLVGVGVRGTVQSAQVAVAETAIQAPEAPAAAEPPKRGRPKKSVEAPAASPAATAYVLNFADGSVDETFTDLAEWASALEDRFNSASSAQELRELNTANSPTIEVLLAQDRARFDALLELFKQIESAFSTVADVSAAMDEAVADTDDDEVPDEAPAEKVWSKEEVQERVRAYCLQNGAEAGREKLENLFGCKSVSTMSPDDYARAAEVFEI